MTVEQDYALMESLHAAWSESCRVLNALSGGGPMNLTPDQVKASPDYQQARTDERAKHASYMRFHSMLGATRFRAVQAYGKRIRAMARAEKLKDSKRDT